MYEDAYAIRAINKERRTIGRVNIDQSRFIHSTMFPVNRIYSIDVSESSSRLYQDSMRGFKVRVNYYLH